VSLILEAEELRQRGPLACLGAAEYVLEIGFGRAELILGLARALPEQVFLGVEVSRKRVEKAARRAERMEVSNVRLVHGPAEYLLERVLPAGSVAECWVNCPDPWPKKRHYKRRLLQTPFLTQLAGVLRPMAILHICTDHSGYAEWIHEHISRVPGLENLHAPAPWSAKPPDRPQTAYELEWLAEGRTLGYFEYRIKSA